MAGRNTCIPSASNECPACRLRSGAPRGYLGYLGFDTQTGYARKASPNPIILSRLKIFCRATATASAVPLEFRPTHMADGKIYDAYSSSSDEKGYLVPRRNGVSLSGAAQRAASTYLISHLVWTRELSCSRVSASRLTNCFAMRHDTHRAIECVMLAAFPFEGPMNNSIMRPRKRAPPNDFSEYHYKCRQMADGIREGGQGAVA